ncbi:YciI family protein [Gandjariella thermophila]|uniref:YCII-related domain-containing protein n=1 Tax=Gandjariella thermophila TaxID=1931992 RepID=A0A4D4J5U3_9PSEU|nr:YciI family protein [Gandjariella thermophila]GDY32075.1 hypothetical protein GTS_37080 [Gandjariella thermophila]
MRFMVIVKATERSEAGELPTKEEIEEMGRFNEELVKAGVMLAGEGLRDSSKGVRIAYSGKDRTVVDGPFAETKELVAGFWLWQVKSREEAIEWARRIPFQEGEVELRQVFESDDFADIAPDAIEQEKRLRAEVEAQQR